mmetsp:Transcript_17663/g.26298  ORF Transcript_17663/g.26298 Transcript_17663/m.26298 type:complete len:270 (+) Transcript_17663:1175-1984(+)
MPKHDNDEFVHSYPSWNTIHLPDMNLTTISISSIIEYFNHTKPTCEKSNHTANRDDSSPTVDEAISSVKNINLKKNEIPVLSHDFFPAFKSLVTLDVSHNHLTTLPTTISSLTNLKNLNAGYNELKEIPPGICLLFNLCSLQLEYNKICVVHEALLDLVDDGGGTESRQGRNDREEHGSNGDSVSIRKKGKLTTLSLKGNPITICPSTVLELNEKSNLQREKKNRYDIMKRYLQWRENANDNNFGITRYSENNTSMGKVARWNPLQFLA